MKIPQELQQFTDYPCPVPALFLSLDFHVTTRRERMVCQNCRLYLLFLLFLVVVLQWLENKTSGYV